MRAFSIILGLSLFILGCTEQKAPPPKGTLPKEKMAEVLTDIHLAEAFVNSETLAEKASNKLFKLYEDSIFAMHSITAEEYYRSHDYYTNHMDDMKEIYEVVVDSLNARKNVLAPPPSIDTK